MLLQASSSCEYGPSVFCHVPDLDYVFAGVHAHLSCSTLQLMPYEVRQGRMPLLRDGGMHECGCGIGHLYAAFSTLRCQLQAPCALLRLLAVQQHVRYVAGDVRESGHGP